jgi:hypothetical protein
MNVLLAVTLLLAQTVPPATAPQSSPGLKTIIDVKSRTLCTALRENVSTSLVGLMKNDRVIDLGSRVFRKMGADQVKKSKALQMDALANENVVGAMVHNLAEIDRLLDDPARFPLNPKTDDERSADRMKAELQAIEDRQKLQLNVINGTIQTDDLSTMEHEFPAFSPVVQPAGTSVSTPPPTTIADAGLPSSPDVPAGTQARTLAAKSLLGNSLYGRIADAMNAEQARTASLENVAAVTIESVAEKCGGAVHAQP